MDAQYYKLATVVDRTKLITIATVKCRGKKQKKSANATAKVPLFLKIPEFPYNAVYDKRRVTFVPQPNSIYPAVSIKLRVVTDRQTDNGS